MQQKNYSNILSNLPDKIRQIISHFVAFLIVVMLLMLLFAAFRSVTARYSGVSESGYVMNTYFEIKVNGKNTADHVRAAIIKINDVAKLINYHDPNSEISSVNNMAGISAVSVSQDTFDIVDKAIRFARRSGGAYDPTIGPLTDIWSYAFKDHKEIPGGNELVYAQHLVNYGNVIVNPQNQTIKLLYPGMKIDLGDVGKGYALTKARAILVERGVTSAMLNAGPIIAAIGDNKGKPWKVDIKDPRRPDEMIGSVSLAGGQALSTTGDYDDYFEAGGRRYHHVIDPSTGMPADQCRSVTIISNDATEAGMLSRAVFIMGPTRGLAFVSTFKDTQAIIVDKDGNVVKSPGVNLER